MNSMELLIVEDDADFRETCARWFRKKGQSVTHLASGEEALRELERQQFHVMLCDMKLPDLSGLELLKRIRARDLETEVIILTGKGSIDSAVEAMKLGATDYLTKPFPLPELEQRCRMAFERAGMRKENRQLRALLDRESPNAEMIGNSRAMRDVFRLIGRIAATDKSVLIQGESGTGKELVAQAVYRGSKRAEKPFVTINCAALPEHLVESELFGHEKGAFTGATEARPGLFEIADGGTLFIDEIGEMPTALQPKLLRVLEDGTFRRVGSVTGRRVNARVLAATNRELGAEVEAKRFREDLYYRINVLEIVLPPLRERRDDVASLVDHFLGGDWDVAPQALAALKANAWPGNVRQLKNVLERAMILADGGSITVDDLPREFGRVSDSTNVNDGTLPDGSIPQLASIEREHIIRVLHEAQGNKSQAARMLGIHRRKLYRLLERLEIPTE